jgi:hypothetical protein
MPTPITIDFESLSVTGPGGSDLIKQTKGVSPVESSGYDGFLALTRRLRELLSKDVISSDQFHRLRDELREEAIERDYDVIYQAQAAGKVADGTTVRVKLHDDQPTITVATSDTEALEGAEQIARECQATSITHISPTIISCTFLSGKHQEEAGNHMFAFWSSETSVTTFKGKPIPYATS